jgi:hypothetical protein
VLHRKNNLFRTNYKRFLRKKNILLQLKNKPLCFSTDLFAIIAYMKIIFPQEPLDLHKKDDGNYPQAVIKKFRLQYTLFENKESAYA